MLMPRNFQSAAGAHVPADSDLWSGIKRFRESLCRAKSRKDGVQLANHLETEAARTTQASSRAPCDVGLCFPSLREAPRDVRRRSVIDAMLRWNVKKSACCHFHSCLGPVVDVANELQ